MKGFPSLERGSGSRASLCKGLHKEQQCPGNGLFASHVTLMFLLCCGAGGGGRGAGVPTQVGYDAELARAARRPHSRNVFLLRWLE